MTQIRFDALLMRRVAGAVIAATAAVWLVVAVVGWLDLAPGNLDILSDPARSLDHGDAGRAIFYAAVAVCLNAGLLAIAISVIRGSELAALTALPILLLLCVTTGYFVGSHNTIGLSASLTMTLFALVTISLSLVIDVRRIRVVVSE